MSTETETIIKHFGPSGAKDTTDVSIEFGANFGIAKIASTAILVLNVRYDTNSKDFRRRQHRVGCFAPDANLDQAEPPCSHKYVWAWRFSQQFHHTNLAEICSKLNASSGQMSIITHTARRSDNLKIQNYDNKEPLEGEKDIENAWNVSTAIQNMLNV